MRLTPKLPTELANLALILSSQVGCAFSHLLLYLVLLKALAGRDSLRQTKGQNGNFYFTFFPPLKSSSLGGVGTDA